MSECVRDRMTITVVSTLKTQGEVPEALDDRLSARRRGVTVVRFDSVDRPSLREAVLAILALPAGGRLAASRCSA
jgi:hypothetical protein